MSSQTGSNPCRAIVGWWKGDTIADRIWPGTKRRINVQDCAKNCSQPTLAIPSNKNTFRILPVTLEIYSTHVLQNVAAHLPCYDSSYIATIPRNSREIHLLVNIDKDVFVYLYFPTTHSHCIIMRGLISMVINSQ